MRVFLFLFFFSMHAFADLPVFEITSTQYLTKQPVRFSTMTEDQIKEAIKFSFESEMQLAKNDREIQEIRDKRKVRVISYQAIEYPTNFAPNITETRYFFEVCILETDPNCTNPLWTNDVNAAGEPAIAIPHHIVDQIDQHYREVVGQEFCPCEDNDSCSLAPLQDVLKKALEDQTNYKSEDEVSDWFVLNQIGHSALEYDCLPDQNHSSIQNYEKEYKEVLHNASKAYGYPYAFVACLGFQESQFNINEPQKGARGLMQMYPQAWTDAYMHHKRRPSKWESFTELNGNSGREFPYKDKDDNDIVDLRYYREMTRLHSDENKRQRQIEAQIGTGMEYLERIKAYFVRKMGGREFQYSDGDYQKMLLLLAASYNSSFSTVERKIREDHGDTVPISFTNLMASIQSVKSDGETNNYIQNISNCMEKGNYSPKLDNDGVVNETQVLAKLKECTADASCLSDKEKYYYERYQNHQACLEEVQAQSP